MLTHIFDPRTKEAESSWSLVSSRPAYPLEWVPGQAPKVHSETLTRKKQNKLINTRISINKSCANFLLFLSCDQSNWNRLPSFCTISALIMQEQVGELEAAQKLRTQHACNRRQIPRTLVTQLESSYNAFSKGSLPAFVGTALTCRKTYTNFQAVIKSCLRRNYQIFSV